MIQTWPKELSMVGHYDHISRYTNYDHLQKKFGTIIETRSRP